VSVGAPGRQLPAVWIDGEPTVHGDPTPPVDEVPGTAEFAEAQTFEPGQGVEGEAVVEEGDVDVVGAKIGPAPQVRSGPEGLRQMGEGALIPRQVFHDLGSD